MPAYLATFAATFVPALCPVPEAVPLPGDEAEAAAPEATWGDFDGDGLEDLYLLVPGAADRLLQNVGDGTFEDVTHAAGLDGSRSRAAAWRDFDGDGRIDLLRVDEQGALRLARGIGQGLFEDVTSSTGLAGLAGVRTAEWLDYDRDGRADLRLATDAGPRVLHNGAAGFEPVRLGPLAPPPVPTSVEAPSARASAQPIPGEVETARRAQRASEARDGAPSPVGASTVPSAGTTNGTRSAAGASGAPGATGPFSTPVPICVDGLVDTATLFCVGLSTTPEIGKVYPLSADFNLDPATGFVGVGTTAPSARLHAKALAPEDDAVLGETASIVGIGVTGNATSSAGVTYGVHGDSASPDGAGVRGANSSVSGNAYGVVGETASLDGTGVLGRATETLGDTSGVTGMNSSADGAGVKGFGPAVGVRGKASAQLGTASGVLGESESPDGAGLRGLNSSGTGSAYGVFAETASFDGIGILGRASDTLGQNVGVLGSSASAEGTGVKGVNARRGVHGYSPAVAGTFDGVLGEADSPDGRGVRGLATSTSGATTGVLGTVLSLSGAGVRGEGPTRGLEGMATGASGMTHGVIGFADSTAARAVAGQALSPTGSTIGVDGIVVSPDGYGVSGFNQSTDAATSKAYGVFGKTNAPKGTAVYGEALGAGTSVGVRGVGNYSGMLGKPATASGGGIGVVGNALAGDVSQTGVMGFGPFTIGAYQNAGVSGGSGSSVGYGVAGLNTAGSGQAWGVYGETFAPLGEGMAGKGYVGAMGRSGASGEGYGTAGIAPSALGAGVAGYATFTGSSPTTLVDAGVTGGTRRTTGAAVAGVASGSSGGASGVFGESWASAGGYGVYGKANLGSNYAVFSEGNLLVGGGGTKMFAHPHPTDASKEIHFVCLEGDESGTYFRGSAVLAGGRAVIAVPEAFRLVTEAEGLTVQLTAMGRGELWVESKGLERIVVRGTADLAFDYFVNGVRAGYADFQPIQENRVYRPRVAGAPYGAGFHPAARAALVRNGTLNADGTPNTATARRLGWNLMENGTPVYSTTGVQLSGPQPTTASLPPRAADPSTSARRRTEDR